MPGATTRPPASMVSAASSLISPTATIRPSRTPTSARRPGEPVPSTTVPPLITQSSMSASSENRTRSILPTRNRAHKLRRGLIGGGRVLRGVERLAAAGLTGGLGLPLALGGRAPFGLGNLALLEQLGPFGGGLCLLRRGARPQGRAPEPFGHPPPRLRVVGEGG